MDQFVILFLSHENLTQVIYFESRVFKILNTISLIWMNRDTKIHRLKSVNADSYYQHNFSLFVILLSGWEKSTTVRIESDQPAIPYYCSLHPAERILIVVLPKDEDKMTNTQ